eukprot:TRINITY_DN10436_c1_g1_i1.p1 TRINITY_DN10436_c1_g1~~TRINITY_DN10436_c1_g1_i1.p1  ORF type:complete len:244 (+),score=31.22 TRINITY_DN10436_c1_g1_i1:465-1196(+)
MFLIKKNRTAPMPIQVLVIGNEKLAVQTHVEVSLITTVQEMKTKVSSEIGISELMFELTFEGSTLETSTEACFYGLYDGCEVGVTDSKRSLALSKLKEEDQSMDGFYTSVTNGNCNLIETYLQAGYDIEYVGRLGVTPLIAAVCRGEDQAALLLIKYGANVNATGRNDNSALHLAPLEMLETLLDAGANINHQNGNGDTPLLLSLAQTNSSYEAARIFVKRGANVSIPNKRGITAMHRIVSSS